MVGLKKVKVRDKKRQETWQREREKPRGCTCVCYLLCYKHAWRFLCVSVSDAICQWSTIYLGIMLNAHLHAAHSRYTYILHTPVCVEGRNGLHSTWVQWLCLLQQDALHQPGDVHIDVAGEAVQAGCIGSYPRQEVRGTSYLLGGLVVIGHSHDDPGETRLTSVRYHQARVDWGWTDGTSKLVKRAMVAWYYTLIRSAHSLLQGFTEILFIFCRGPSFSLFLSLTRLRLQFWPWEDQSLRACCSTRALILGWQGR